MAFSASMSTKEPRSFSVGPIKFQPFTWSAASGDTSGTVTALNLSKIEHILLDGDLEHSAAPTFSGNVATLAIVVPAAVAASLEVQDLTYTADDAGTDGNSITITYTGGATAGAEVVTVDGNDISVQIEDGVSTATQVKTAVDADMDASALISVAITGTAGTAQDIASEAPLAGGLDGGGYGTGLAIGR